MTRKQALIRAVALIKSMEATDETQSLIEKLLELEKDMPITHWTEATIFDTLDQFAMETGRTPTTTDLKLRGMPPHPVIKLRFAVTAKEFLAKHYPQPARLCGSRAFGNKSADEWLAVFTEEYNRIKPTSADIFNQGKQKELPTWVTFAAILGKKNWLELLAFANLPRIYSSRVPQYLSKNRTVLSVSHTSELVDELENLENQL